jgi:integrase/recombinase XerD
MRNIQEFKKYLKANGFSWQSVNGYGYAINSLLQDHPNADSFTYVDVLGYLDKMGKLPLVHSSKATKLNAIKKYYDFLIDQGKRDDHPCKRIYLKGNSKRNVIHNDLFSSAELESLLEREEHWSFLKVLHQVTISLFIYQGLLPGEVANLKVSHVDIDKETILIKSGKMLSARKLEMHHNQLPLFDQYLNHDRKRLLKKGEIGYFLVHWLGDKYKPESIVRCIETLKDRFPDRNLTAKTIRDSVIANLLNERRLPLEQVQLFAGHRWISSTQRYYQSSLEEQKEILRMFHPLE